MKAMRTIGLRSDHAADRITLDAIHA